ncbi:MAG: sugar phosphate isomerase/epimerase [Anaeromicrobium sp.]|uniref:sugar phosphate isomerase/epimerase family protein n=1 Tax=Anaeromicrobium sp. TaxID=1929132 RepID=UPI0025E05C66|nr:sugar phosphate isomerase/epimerase family protein [Anaeromicrobium sp.]MCT4595445.1 sugar phosphate isomerase/epimerase [Anaeromicrobium sp.]
MIAFATDYKGEEPNISHLEDVLKNISNAGFNFIHWVHEWQGNYIYSKEEMLQIKDLIDKYNLKVKGIHGSEGGVRLDIEGRYKHRNEHDNRKDYTSVNEYNRKAGVELIKNRVDLASIIGAKEVVIHMQLPWKSMEESQEFKDIYYSQVFKSLDELKDYCINMGVKIGIENLIGTPNKWQIEQFDMLFSRYDKEFLGFCFDSGHGLIMNGEDPFQLVRRYLDRLIGLHLNDNRGATKEELENDLSTVKNDLHMIPFEGDINWHELIKIIKDSPYKLPLTMELSLREKDEKAFLDRAYKAGMRLLDIYEKA